MEPVANTVSNVVIVGGGTAGWLAACLIAARADPRALHPITVTLIESPEVPTIGVGEGTWPTMRRTLQRIGIGESDFLLACDGAFKQGSRFVGWRDGGPDDAYLHPFGPPIEGDPRDVVAAWRDHAAAGAAGATGAAAGAATGVAGSFADTVTAQAQACARDLAPRQRAMPDYAGALNYAYHLDAGKLAALLMRHATERLGVRHVRDHVVTVEPGGDCDIAAVATRDHGAIAGDLFLDCTGQAALLIGKHYGIATIDRGGELFNDSAIAVQLPVSADSAIASQTDATAHAAGWIWDIGLPTRRGVGCVYSSAHSSDDAARTTLDAYLRRTAPGADLAQLTFRRLSFRSGHRAEFWHRNCIAIGQAAGFLEPLEASAIVMIELSLEALLDGFPASRAVMPILADRFNALFRYRWDRIVEFLKLHYVLSARDEPYWRDHRDPGSIPPRLAELLTLWRDRPPSRADLPAAEEVFPAASYLYVLYGMGFPPPPDGAILSDTRDSVAATLRQIGQRGRTLAASLPTNRAYLDALAAAHAPLEQVR